MKVLRKVDIYSLVKSSQSKNKNLNFYIDNGEDVTEYFDQYEKDRLLNIENDQAFLNECALYF